MQRPKEICYPNQFMNIAPGEVGITSPLTTCRVYAIIYPRLVTLGHYPIDSFSNWENSLRCVRLLREEEKPEEIHFFQTGKDDYTFLWNLGYFTKTFDKYNREGQGYLFALRELFAGINLTEHGYNYDSEVKVSYEDESPRVWSESSRGGIPATRMPDLRRTRR